MQFPVISHQIHKLLLVLVLSEYISVVDTENPFCSLSRFHFFNHFLYILCMYINLNKVNVLKSGALPRFYADQCSYCFLTAPVFVGELQGVDHL